MSGHELNRVEVMGRVKNGDLKLSDAAVMLNVSYRQAKRLWRRYRKLGSEGLKHGNVGRPSNRRKPLKVLQRTAFWPEFSSWQPRTRSCIRWHRQKFGPTPSADGPTEMSPLFPTGRRGAAWIITVLFRKRSALSSELRWLGSLSVAQMVKNLRSLSTSGPARNIQGERKRIPPAHLR